jgi:hypothetical protein
MSDIEQIIKEATINLPMPLNREEAEKMMQYLAQEIPASVNTKVEYFKNFLNDKGKVEVDEGTLKINGQINARTRPFAFDYFSSEPDFHQTEFIDKIIFNLTPGWDLQDYRTEVRELWKRTRTVVEEYFQKENFLIRGSKKA